MTNKTVYYSLVWNSINDYKVHISTNEILDMQNYISEVKLRESNIILKVYGEIKHNSAEVIDKDSNYRTINNVPFLKSNLQKAVRRGKVDIALVTAYNLIIADFWEFTRRLIIISLEDVSYLDNTDFLVWCMLAYPNFEITNEIIQYLLTTVYKLVTSKKILKIKKIDQMAEIPISDSIRFPLLIRKAYGGLKGDMKMINYLCRKPIKDSQIIKVPRKRIKITRPFCNWDIIYEAIDFHICSKMIPHIINKSEIKDKDLIKKIIWFNNSAYNIRRPNIEYEKENWEKIKDIVNDFQKKYNVR